MTAAWRGSVMESFVKSDSIFVVGPSILWAFLLLVSETGPLFEPH